MTPTSTDSRRTESRRTESRRTSTLAAPPGTARAAGVLYLLIFFSGLFAELVVRQQLIEPGDAGATAANILDAPGLFRLGVGADVVMLVCDVAIAVVLYLLLRPLSPTLSLLAAAFRLTQSAVLGLNLLSMFEAVRILGDADYLGVLGSDPVDALALLSLDRHRFGYILGLTFFGVATAIIGWIAVRSRRMPTALGVLLVVAGAGYVADMATFFLLPGYDGAASAVLLAPALVGELWFAVWLLTRGRSLEAPADRSATRSPDGVPTDLPAGVVTA